MITNRIGLGGVLIVLLTGVALSVQAAVGDHAATLQFQVRANPSDAVPRCAVASSDYCRDDLDLSQVFDSLNRMAAGFGRSPFGAAGKGVAVQVNLGPGIFRLQRELVLADWPSVGSFGPLNVTGAGADKTVIVGTIAVPDSAWRVVSSADTRVAAFVLSKVRAADLSALLKSPVPARRRAAGFDEPIAPVQLEVFVNDRPMTLARWPNTGWAQVDVPKGATDTAGPSRNRFSVRNGHLADWKNEPNLFVTGYFSYDWAYERIPVVSVDAEDGRPLLQSGGAKFGFRQGGRVVVENALNELDSPGEWYFDNARQILYFWPFEPAATTQVEVSWLPSLLSIKRSNSVTLGHLGFQGSTGDAVRISQSHNVSLVDTVVRNTGNRAVVIDGGSAVALRRIVMTDLGDGGVFVSGGDRRTLSPAGHVIEACHIERFSRLSHSYRPAVAVEGVGIQVLRNRIADGPHAAIVFSGNDHRIEGNHISDVVTETNDAGAIYTGRDWTARGTVIANNLVQNVYARLPGTHSVMGVYLDDQASGITISGNVFANVGNAVFIGGGRDNVVDANIFVASSMAIFVDNRGLTWQRNETQDPNYPLQRNLRNMPVTGGWYRMRYPHLADILKDEPGRSKYNRAANNIFVATHDFEFLDDAQTGIERIGNRTVPWSVFKTLRASKQTYTPHDFDLLESAIALGQANIFPSRDGIAP